MIQLAFDIFDSNNDGKVSELDLFKILWLFSSNSNYFEIIHQDICQITSIITKN